MALISFANLAAIGGIVGRMYVCHSGNLYGFGHVICNTPVTLVGVSSCHCSLMHGGPFRQFLCLSTVDTVRWEEGL